jgi:hypothetical protein
MKRYAKIWAALIFCGVSLLTFVGGASCAVVVGKLTDSGMLGICGPYGDHAGLVGCIFLGSFPAAIVVGLFSARNYYRRVRDDHNSPNQPPS